MVAPNADPALYVRAAPARIIMGGGYATCDLYVRAAPARIVCVCVWGRPSSYHRPGPNAGTWRAGSRQYASITQH